MPRQPWPKTWRQRVRFNVRTMMIAVLVLCGSLGWVVRRAGVQREAVAAIRRAGGDVVYDWQLRNGIPVWGGKPWAPGWLVDLLGVDYFGVEDRPLAFNLNPRDSAPPGVSMEVTPSRAGEYSLVEPDG